MVNPHTVNLPFLAYQYKPMGLSQGFKIIEEITTITEDLALGIPCSYDKL